MTSLILIALLTVNPIAAHLLNLNSAMESRSIDMNYVDLYKFENTAINSPIHLLNIKDSSLSSDVSYQIFWHGHSRMFKDSSLVL